MSLELSIEFFPPQTTEGMEKLRATRTRLAALKPEFFSVTYGAGGSTRENTLATVMEIAAEGHSAAPHLSCIGSTRAGIREMLTAFIGRDIRRIVAAAAAHLLAGGWLLFEHGYDQGAASRNLLTHAGFKAASTHPDLAGIDRVSGGHL